ncbi:hypothetical protein tb265_00370 [Gemmatimonadetes bacterium T265]|nr:hypothetical protein tb265_00370 [Gemmatimonadetes bacterium T265]
MTPARAIARACATHFRDLPLPALAVLVGHLDGLADELPPDDRSVLVAPVEDGALEPAVLAWWRQQRRDLARRYLARAWAAALKRDALPFVPLPDVPWPARPAGDAPPAPDVP